MIDGFLLTRQWRESSTKPNRTAAAAQEDGVTLDFWFATDQGPRWVQITRQEAVLFIARADANAVAALLGTHHDWRQAQVSLANFHNQPVNALYLRSQRRLFELRDLLHNRGIRCWEADIRPPERYLMERFITGGCQLQGGEPASAKQPWRNPRLVPMDYRPRLKRVSVDIETSMKADELYSIAVWAEEDRRVFMVGTPDHDGNGEIPAESDSDYVPSFDIPIQYCPTQADCLRAFLDWIGEYDPDVLIGWNLVQFDLWVLEQLSRRLRVPFLLGRARQALHWREDGSDRDRHYVTIPGRVALDGIELLKAATYHFDSYALENVAQQLLGQGKLLSGSDRGGDITALFQCDKPRLAAYNLRDCELVWDIFLHTKLLEFAVERSQLTGLLMDRIGGSVASFEFAYLPRLHREGYVAPNLGELESDVVSPGGFVMDSQPGIYDNVLVLDFKSLYPSIIRSFKIDPCGFWLAQHRQLPPEAVVPGFNGARFAKQGHILPGIITELWQARDRAKSERNQPLSQAIKIIMNSFYGVLGSPGCRFFDPRVSSSITLRGHEIIQCSADWLRERGLSVIYGDTDSVFVWLNRDCSPAEARAIGVDLANGLNAWWAQELLQKFGVESALEIEFETHYRRFLMPTIRGSDKGSKKRYAGLVQAATDGGSSVGDDPLRLVFKGLENVRTDWTPLARDFQEELYKRIFYRQPFAAMVRSLVADVWAGRCDSQLVYRKRLRRQLADYQKNVPPHVRAARRLEELSSGRIRPRRGDWVEYLITLNGPEPVQFRRSSIDYSHYIERQLKPVADSILHFLNTSFDQIVDRQLGLFED